MVILILSRTLYRSLFWDYKSFYDSFEDWFVEGIGFTFVGSASKALEFGAFYLFVERDGIVHDGFYIQKYYKFTYYYYFTYYNYLSFYTTKLLIHLLFYFNVHIKLYKYSNFLLQIRQNWNKSSQKIKRSFYLTTRLRNMRQGHLSTRRQIEQSWVF